MAWGRVRPARDVPRGATSVPEGFRRQPVLRSIGAADLSGGAEDQFLGGRDDFIGQEFEQVILTGEADRFECTLFYEEIAEHGPVRAFLLKDRDKEDPPAKGQAHRHQTDLE